MLTKILIGLVLIITAVMTFGFLTKDKFGDKPIPFIGNYLPSRDYFEDISAMPSCGDKKELFSTFPLALSSLTSITPLGNIAPAAHTLPTAHLYFNIKSSGTNIPEIDLIAPADLKITTVKWLEAKNKPEWNDGALVFGVCKEFKAYFDHVKSFSEKIKKAYDNNPFKACNEYSLDYPLGKIDYRLCVVKVDINIKAGEKIGTAGGGEGQRVLDVGAFDTRITPHKFANSKRWQDRKQMESVVCALDYFQNDMSKQLKARLGGYNTEGYEVKAEGCGEVIQDIAGTAMGVWAQPGDEEIVTESTNLALVHENIEPQYLAISMAEAGGKAGLPPGKYTFLPKDKGMTNRRFKDIRADGKVYCFETVERHYNNKQPVKFTILINMSTEDKLRIGKLDTESCGSGPWTMQKFVEFVR